MGQIKGQLIDFFIANPNRVVTIGEIALAIGETEIRRVQQNVNNLRNTRDSSINWKELIDVVSRGSSWIYRPDNQPASSPDGLFELIGKSRSGVLILQDSEGRIFQAKELD